MASRYSRMLLKNLFVITRLHFKAKKISKKNKMSFDDRYKYAMKFVKIYHRDMRVKMNVYGLEKLDPSINGCVFMGNHQGQEDGTAILEAISRANMSTSFVINDARSHYFFFGNVCDMLGVKRIKFEDLRSQIQVYNEIADELKEGKNFVIFPEAGYADNKNNLREFNTPCFAPVLKSKCPIIPFVLYDTWKAYHKDYEGRYWLTYEVHFLDPIYHEEYSGMNKQKLCQLVKDRVAVKLAEIKKSKNEEN